MKAKNVVVFIALVLVLFQGCVPSIHPLYTKDKLVTNEKVVGIWKTDAVESDFKSEWHFTENSDGSYHLIYYDTQGTPGIFDAHLIRLGEHYFFNFLPITGYNQVDPQKFNEFEALHFHPMNTFAKVIIEDDQIGLSMFNGDFLEKLLKQNRIRIKHEKVEDSYVLTASSKELQKFVLKYAEDEDAFPEPEMLVKSL